MTEFDGDLEEDPFPEGDFDEGVFPDEDDEDKRQEALVLNVYRRVVFLQENSDSIHPNQFESDGCDNSYQFHNE